MATIRAPAVQRDPDTKVADSPQIADETSFVYGLVEIGVVGEAPLTDELFFARHPDREKTPIESASSPEAAEWIDIRDTVVRPVVEPFVVRQWISGGTTDPDLLTEMLAQRRSPQPDASTKKRLREDIVSPLLQAHDLQQSSELPAGSLVEGALEQAAGAGAARLAEFAGTPINTTGRISSPDGYYDDVLQNGKIIRDAPTPDARAVGRMAYGEGVVVKAANKSNGEWAFVVGEKGTRGWVQRYFLAESPPDPRAALHHVREANLGTILAAHYQDKYEIRSGDDYRVLAVAVGIANRERSGVTLDPDKLEKSLSDNTLINIADPWNAVNRIVYQSIEVTMGSNIWLPSVEYIEALKGDGAIMTRPDWISELIDAGKAVAGFYAGVASGFFGGIWDSITGLYDLVASVIDTIGKVFTGELFTELQTLYQELSGLTLDGMAALVKELISSIWDEAQDFITRWKTLGSFDKGFFAGKLAGAVALEVVLAMFTGGAGNAAKWAAKVGKYAPKLSSLLTKSVKAADKLIPDSLKKKQRGADKKDNKDDADSHKKMVALGLAKAALATVEARDGTLAELKTALGSIKKAYKNTIDKFEYERTGATTFRVWMIASKHAVGEHDEPWDKPKNWKVAQKGGKWLGPEGDSLFELTDKDIFGEFVGAKIPFRKGWVNFTEWADKRFATFEVKNMTGYHKEDMKLIYEHIKDRFTQEDGSPFKSANQVKLWLAEQELTPHHAGGYSVQLIPTKLHGNISHMGGAFELRNNITE